MELPPLLLPQASLYQSTSIICASLISMEVLHQLFRRHCQQLKCSEQQQLMYNKTAVQFTHLAVNCILALSGLYCWYKQTPHWNDCSLIQRWTGFQNFSFFGNIMISYNVWSSYASRRIFGHEDVTMACHHIMACVIGFFSSFTHYGWNYYAPFFFGVIEVSSLPLSLLNAFNFRDDWVVAYPTLHLFTKIFFAIAFIGTRVFLWNSNMHLFFKDTLSLIANNNPEIANISATTRFVTLLAADVPALFLTFLQLFWAFKILEALLNMVLGGAKKQPTVKKES